MRTFYIFKINKEFKIITKNNPYNLYLAFNNIHNMNKDDVNLGLILFKEMCEIPKYRELNLAIFNKLKDSDYYTKFNNKHLINNYYTDEKSSLTVKRIYLKLESSKDNPVFFKVLRCIPNLFVIDFKNMDYFWLS